MTFSSTRIRKLLGLCGAILLASMATSIISGSLVVDWIAFGVMLLSLFAALWGVGRA